VFAQIRQVNAAIMAISSLNLPIRILCHRVICHLELHRRPRDKVANTQKGSKSSGQPKNTSVVKNSRYRVIQPAAEGIYYQII
jgi:hypothetical protein